MISQSYSQKYTATFFVVHCVHRLFTSAQFIIVLVMSFYTSYIRGRITAYVYAVDVFYHKLC